MRHYIVVTIETADESSVGATETPDSVTTGLINEITANLESVGRDFGITSLTVANGGAIDKHYRQATISRRMDVCTLSQRCSICHQPRGNHPTMDGHRYTE